MSNNTIFKNFHLWFSKLKCFPTMKPPPSSSSSSLTTLKAFNNSEEDYYSTTSTADDRFFTSLSDTSTTTDSDTVPDLSAVLASHRFFFSSPGFSNSIFESPDARSDTVADGVEVRKFSMDPYVDFRNSMMEMIEARDEILDVKNDWQYLQELLLCYLQLNPIDTHKFILNAFSDLVIYLLGLSSESATSRRMRRSFDESWQKLSSW